MTTHTGSTAFSNASRKEVCDDLPPDGLLKFVAESNDHALKPAVDTALGKAQQGGRLVWQLGLPESLHHDADAKTAIMFPDWDVRRGRTHIDYSNQEAKIEVFAGRAKAVAGIWQTMITVDSREQQPDGEWCEVCEYTDDDVHYIEIEQNWTAGILLQRQIVLVRDDRCLLLADAVLPSSDRDDQPIGAIEYTSRLPLTDSIQVEPELDTRELHLSDGRHHGMTRP